MDLELYLSNAKFAASTGNIEEARNLLKQVLDYDPRNARAWLLLAEAVSSTKHAKLCLERALRLEPENEQARQKLAMYKLEEPSSESSYGLDDWLENELDNVTIEEPADRQAIEPAGEPAAAPWSYETYTAKKHTAEAVLRAELPPEFRPKKSRLGWEAALIGVLGLTAICILGLLLVPGLPLLNTSRASAQPQPDEAVTDVIIQNIIASNNEDFDGYMATIHSQSPSYESTAEMLGTIFNDFDLVYQISELEVLEQTAKEAQVNFVLTTRKVHGPKFQDNKVSGTMILRKDDGAWKIYDQKIENVEYLN